ncbi:IS481 family transposase, partial [Legionella adelaidensis]
MSWQEKNTLDLRKEFVLLASQEGANIAELCRRYEVSRKTGYKWLKRYNEQGFSALNDHSKRPKRSPLRTGNQFVNEIIKVRNEHPYWGARKIKVILEREKNISIASSTIHSVLEKYGFIHKEKSANNHFHRFEHEAPNHLWQMDFKGHFAYERGRCFPLTVLDDHSRYSIVLEACTNERGETVKPILIEAFRRYGLPERINVDNGNPWGSLYDSARYTTFSLWLIRIGVKVSYSRPAHPQTNGKDERFHRTLKVELLNSKYFKNLTHIQDEFRQWREVYNLKRPHEGIGMKVPAQRYHPSYRKYPEILPQIEYSPDYDIKKTDCRGRLHFQGRQVFIGMPFSNQPIGIRQNAHSDILEVYFSHQKLGEVNLNQL